MKDYSSIIVSSKVRLLRNLVGFEFPSMFSGDAGIKVLNKLADTILKIDKSFKLYKVQTLPELDVNVMHEKKLITNKLIDAASYGAVVLSADEEVSIMINETDHIAEQCMMQGLNLIKAYDRLNDIDNELLSKLDIAYDDSIGFLTSNVANVGTGLKASVKLFLPALTMNGKIREIISTLSNQGFEFSSNDDEFESHAYTYTISNAITIGRKETDFVVKVTEYAIKISEMEIKARNDLLSAYNIDDVQDKVQRAWGEFTERLKNADLTPVIKTQEENITVLADGRHLWRVFDNLLSNVCKYSMPGTRVYITVTDNAKRTEITFRNISKYELDMGGDELMERFTRGDKSRNTEGHGLGLSIAESLLTLQGAGLEVTVDGDLFKATVIFPKKGS